MESLGHDLLILMLHLSRMTDRERIVRVFVEALAAAAPGVTVRLLGPGQETPGEVLEIATPEAAFGRLALEDPAGALSDLDRGRFRNATRMLAVVLENIQRAERLASENARLDAAVAARTGELRGALERLEDLYQHAPCGYHSLDADAVYVRVNDTELGWLGYRREELVGKVRFSDLVAPGSMVRFLHGFTRVKERGAERALELELVRKDGTRLPVLMSISAVVENGRFRMSRGTMFDLSERRRAERTLQETEERLRRSQKLEALGRLASGVAHDFNNLLTIILSCAGELVAGLPPEGPHRPDAQEIADAARKATQLTRQLLAFGRRQASRPVPLRVADVVGDMEKMLRRLIGEDVELVILRSPGHPLVLADPGHIEQVVLNLVVNARDAMPGGGRITVETAAVTLGADVQGLDLAPGPYVRLTVSDTGSGMTGEVRAHLFEPFFTTKSEGKGTGLGLATVYGIARQARGDVRVESEPGRGARFEVYFPASAEAPEEAADEGTPGLDRVLPGEETILLVEDEERVRAVQAQALRRAGYRVLEAPDGEAALAIAAGAPRLDLLVTDVVMPRLGGVALAARVRAQRGGLPVIFVSGYGGEVPADAEPSTAVLLKPFDAAALTRTIRERLAAPAPPPLTPGSTG